MALPFGVSGLYTLLLWSCISFTSQKGDNIAHGYSFSDDRYSNQTTMLGPRTSNQFHSGANTNHDSFSPGHEMQATKHQSIVSPETEPVHHDNSEDASSATNLSEEMMQSKPAPSVIKYEKESSGNEHPFSLLVKENTMDGVSFPTIADFQMFIETMKRSFLTPGSDLNTHFKTAWESMGNEMAPNSQNTEVEHTKESTAHLTTSENEVWNEPVNTVFEQNGQGASYQIPSENLSVPDPVDSTASLISAGAYDNLDLGPALYPQPHVGPAEHVSSNYGSSDSGGISGENPDISMSAPDVQNEHVESTSHKFPERMPLGSFFVENFSFSPSQDFNSYPGATSNAKSPHSENSAHIHAPYSENTFTGIKKTGVQSEVLGRTTPDNVLSPPKPPSLNSYGKSVYVSAPRHQHNIPPYVPKHKERPTSLFQAYQSTAGKASEKTDYTTIIQPPASSSVSSTSENLSTHSTGGHEGVQTSNPHDVYNPLVFTVKPPSSLHGSSRHGCNFRDQDAGYARPSTLTPLVKDETSDPLEQNLVSAIQEPKEMTENDISGALDSTQSGILSLEDRGFNSLINLAPALEGIRLRLVGNKGMSRNSGINNIISDRFPTGDMHGARNPFGSFPNPQTRGMSLNVDYVGASKTGPLQTFIQQSKVQKRPVHVNKEPGTVTYRRPKPPSAFKQSGSILSSVLWRNDGNAKRLPPQMDPNKSLPVPVKTYYVKSRSNYARGKVYQSKTNYTPHQLDEGKTGKRQWKPARKQQHKYKNTESQPKRT